MNTRKAIVAYVFAALFVVTAGLVWAQGTTPTTPTTTVKTTKAVTPTTAVTTTKPAPKTAATTTAKTTTTTAVAAGSRTIIGEIVDPGCWLVNGAKGDSHKECAIACAKAGQTLAVLEKKTGKLYYSLTDKPGDDPNKGLIDYVAQTMVVKGKVYTRGGAVGIKVTSVEPYSVPKGE